MDMSLTAEMRRVSPRTVPGLEAALEQNHRGFRGFLSRRLADPDEAEDVLQDFHLKALNREHEVHNRESTRAWLYRLLRTTLIDHYRKTGRRARLDALYMQEATLLSDAGTEARAETCRCLFDLLPSLRTDYADLLRRVDLDEEPRPEVAEALGLTINNLAVRLHRAKQALKRALIETCGTGIAREFHDCSCSTSARSGPRSS